MSHTKQTEIWERQPGESEKAYEAFKTYRDMGTERGVQKVADKLSKSRTLISRWKNAWDWDKRVRAYESEIEREAKAKAVSEYKSMINRHVNIAMQLQGKALKALAKIDPDELTARDIRETLKISTEMERTYREIEAGEVAEDEEGNTTLQDAIVAAYKKRTEES